MPPLKSAAAFTLVEVIIGMTLSLMIMGGVLSAYTFLGRSFARSFGVSGGNGASLESQGRSTLAYFSQDVQTASGLVTTAPTAPDTFPNTVKLILPSGAGAKTILYYYNSATTDRYLHADDAIDSIFDGSGVEFKSGTLTRVIMSTPRVAQTLHRSLLSCNFSYYDSTGKPYTVFDPLASNFSSLSGIKQIAVEFSSQAGSSNNGTLTQVYRVMSPRVILLNKQLLR